MVSKLTVEQVFQIMSDNDFAYLNEYEPETLISLCNALSIEYQEKLENESISNRGNLC
jgi:hypothetical protein